MLQECVLLHDMCVASWYMNEVIVGKLHIYKKKHAKFYLKIRIVTTFKGLCYILPNLVFNFFNRTYFNAQLFVLFSATWNGHKSTKVLLVERCCKLYCGLGVTSVNCECTCTTKYCLNKMNTIQSFCV